jgi:hypothetical protein
MDFNFISKLKLKLQLQLEEFLTTPFSMFFNPTYIIRRELYTSILKFSPKINGRVLDFGCGTKPYESVFINAKSYLGVDIKVSGNKHKDKVDYFYDGKIYHFQTTHLIPLCVLRCWSMFLILTRSLVKC